MFFYIKEVVSLGARGNCPLINPALHTALDIIMHFLFRKLRVGKHFNLEFLLEENISMSTFYEESIDP